MLNNHITELNQKAKSFERKNPKKAMEFAFKALKLAVETGQNMEIAQSYLRIGRSMWLLGNHQEAIKYLNKGLDTAKSAHNQQTEAEILNALGNVHVYLQIYDSGFIYYNRAVKIAREAEFLELEARVLNNMGSTYLKLGELDLAIRYLSEALETSKKAQDEIGERVCQLNLGEVYFKKGDYQHAKQIMLNSLESLRKMNYRIGQLHSFRLLGQIEKAQKEYEAAHLYFARALTIADESGSMDEQVDVLINIADTFLLEKRVEAAVDELTEALKIANLIDGVKFLPTIYSKLAQAYDLLNNFDQALFFYRKYHEMSIKIEAERQDERLRGISFQVQLEQSQQETETYRALMNELEKRTKELEQSYAQIQVVSEIGQSITSTLSLEKSFNRIYDHINKLMHSTVLGIGLYNEEEACIKFILNKEYGQDIPKYKIPLDSETSWAVLCFKNRQEIIINDVEKEYPKYLKGIKSSVGRRMASIMFHPLIIDDHIIGVITVQSDRKHAYTKREADTLRILASYVAIAINNAQTSKQLEEEIRLKEKTQLELEKVNKYLKFLSDLDGLTNIPNRRCFDENIELLWDQAIREHTSISLVLIDVDQFKSYNDNYGHLEGDEVLKLVAKAIESVTNQYQGFAARFGGDEFVIILRDMTEVIPVLHDIDMTIHRLNIEHAYSKKSDRITLSKGFATAAPKAGDKWQELLLQADLSLYENKNGQAK